MYQIWKENADACLNYREYKEISTVVSPTGWQTWILNPQLLSDDIIILTMERRTYPHIMKEFYIF